MASIECSSFCLKLRGHNWSEGRWMREMSHSLPQRLGRRGDDQDLDTQLRKPSNAQERRRRRLSVEIPIWHPLGKSCSMHVHFQVSLEYPTIMIVQLDLVDYLSLNQLRNLEGIGWWWALIFHGEYPQKVRFMNILCLYLFAFQGMFIVCHQLTSSRISQWRLLYYYPIVMVAYFKLSEWRKFWIYESYWILSIALITTIWLWRLRCGPIQL
jgi:hypothetical protein